MTLRRRGEGEGRRPPNGGPRSSALRRVDARRLSAAVPLVLLGAALACDPSSDDGGASSCVTPDPTNSSTGDYCTAAIGTRCCGDVGHAFVCTEGAWVCPPRTIPVRSCTSRCDLWDSGVPD